MPEWYIRIFLSVVFSSFSFADITHYNTTKLKKCEGETVNFNYPFQLKEYKRVKWTYSRTSSTTATDIAKSKDIEKGQIEYLADGYEDRLEVFPDSTIKFSLRQITRKDNGTYSFVIIHNNGDQVIFDWNLKVEAVTNITTPSVTTNIVSGTECTEYVCSTEQKDVHRSWIYQGDKQINGSTLRLCNTNRSRAVSCIVKVACSSNYTTVIEALDDDDDDSCLGCHICIGIGICLFIAILIVTLIFLMQRRGNKYNDAEKNEQISQDKEPKQVTTKLMKGEANGVTEANTEPFHKDNCCHCMENLKTSS